MDLAITTIYYNEIQSGLIIMFWFLFAFSITFYIINK